MLSISIIQSKVHLLITSSSFKWIVLPTPSFVLFQALSASLLELTLTQLNKDGGILSVMFLIPCHTSAYKSTSLSFISVKLPSAEYTLTSILFSP